MCALLAGDLESLDGESDEYRMLHGVGEESAGGDVVPEDEKAAAAPSNAGTRVKGLLMVGVHVEGL